MTTDLFTRREFAARSAEYLSAAGMFGIAATSLAGPMPVIQAGAEITHDSDAIHHDVTFKASRRRVYELLTTTAAFDRVVKLSDAMKGGAPPNAKPTEISADVGGTFTLFGGVIGGRHIERVQNERLVQAWRPSHWKPGTFSIARFLLSDQGTGTKLVFDHTGFPKGEAQSLSDGWHKNYWEPMAKALA